MTQRFSILVTVAALSIIVGCDKPVEASQVAQQEKQASDFKAVNKSPAPEKTEAQPEKSAKSTAPKSTANTTIATKPLTQATNPAQLPKITSYKTIEWTDLMPKEDLEALMNPPSYISEIEDGSVEDQIASQMQSAIEAASDDKYQQALVSTKIIKEMDGAAIRLPGFIVPLEFDDQQTITQFFLVPFFGACIHLPPPPPNQIIYVNYPKGIQVATLVEPFWLSGVLRTTLIENDMAKAAYVLEMQTFEEYTEPE